MTVRLDPENLTRAPLELGCRPSPASNMPAFAISSLNFSISVSSRSLGITPASESLLAFTINMKRILLSLVFSGVSSSSRPETHLWASTNEGCETDILGRVRVVT
jgi:hypothetical protein